MNIYNIEVQLDAVANPNLINRETAKEHNTKIRDIKTIRLIKPLSQAQSGTLVYSIT